MLGSLLALFSRVNTVAGEPPPRYFPLDAGRVWNFTVENEPWPWREIIVLAREGDIALVRFQLFHPYLGTDLVDVRLRERGPEIEVELGDEGFLPFYRFDEESFYHRDWHICRDDVTVRLAELSVTIVVPAGTFMDCVSVGYPLKCADGGTRWQTFCPDTGLVDFGEGFFGGTGTWQLQGLEPITKPFVRGDANVDGSVNLADAFAILNALFIWGSFHYLACEDAADANDDGAVNITDAVFTLNHLFIGGRPIPPPNECKFPTEEDPDLVQDFDPTPDEVHCASFPWCCNFPECRQ